MIAGQIRFAMGTHTGILGGDDDEPGDILKKSRQAAKGMNRVNLNNIELASSETARRINRETVLRLIHARQPISRADLARLSGLQRSTVSQIIEQLIGERWILEG